jgi:hypothetical protein
MDGLTNIALRTTVERCLGEEKSEESEVRSMVEFDENHWTVGEDCVFDTVGFCVD